MRMRLNNRGFTLLEVMVTVGILAVISGIAIPQYTKYKTSSSYQAVGIDLQTVRKQFGVCMAVNSDTADCNTQAELDINITGLQDAKIGSDGTNFCAGIDRAISGVDVKSCIEVVVSTGVVGKQTTNQKMCYKESGSTAGVCTSSAYEATCDTEISWSKGTCDVNTDCAATGFYCQRAQGECTQATGVCS